MAVDAGLGVLGAGAGKAAAKVVSKVAPKVVGALKSGIARGKSVAQAEGRSSGPTLRYSQISASPNFHPKGTFAGETIGGLAAKLRSGAVLPSQVPVKYVNLDGNNLIVNTRSSLALTRAGVPQASWTLIESTATEGSDISRRLIRNELTSEGTSTLRITGCGRYASNLE
jgi:hypothetical protein